MEEARADDATPRFGQLLCQGHAPLLGVCTVDDFEDPGNEAEYEDNGEFQYRVHWQDHEDKDRECASARVRNCSDMANFCPPGDDSEDAGASKGMIVQIYR